MQYVLLLIYLFLLVVFYVLYLRGRFLLNPVAVFCGAYSISTFGILRLLDFSSSSDVAHAIHLFVFFMSFCSGVWISYIVKPVKLPRARSFWRSDTHIADLSESLFPVYLIAVFSMILSILYFKAVGYNLFFEFLKGAGSDLLGGTSDVGGLRLRSYAGENYYAPGYINQFKNTLLPLVSLFIAYRGYEIRNKFQLYFGIASILLSFVFLLGTGQRGSFFTYILVLIYFQLAISYRSGLITELLRQLLRLRNILFLLLCLGMLILTSFAQSRFGSSGTTILVKIISFVEHAFIRIGYINENAAIVAFDYFYLQPVQFGSQWLDSILGVLPWHSGSDLNSIIFDLIWGAGNGNSPPSFVGSIYYNFGLVGMVFIPFVIGWLYHWVFFRLINGRKSLARLITFTAIALILGRWVYGGPLYLLNQGIVVLVFLAFVSSKRFSGLLAR